MYHSFHIELAKEYDIESAILIQHFDFWLTKNQSNKQNKSLYIEGTYWTYNSADAFSAIFPYMNRQKISRLLRRLEEKNVIRSNNFNKLKYDRTKWYTFTDEFVLAHSNMLQYNYEKTIIKNQTNHCLKINNGKLNNEQPIPDIITDIISVNELSKDNSIDLRSDSLFDMNKSSIENVPKKETKKPSYMNTPAYELIKKYYTKFDSKLKLPTKENNYKRNKTIEELIQRIQSLLKGTFITDYPMNVRAINIAIVDHPMTILELEDLIETAIKNYELIHKGNYEPTDKSKLKINMNSFLYNSRSESSWFLYCLTEPPSIKRKCAGEIRSEIPDRIVRVYENLYRYKMDNDEKYNFYVNMKNTIKFIESYFNKVDDIYRYNTNYLNYFSTVETFVGTQIRYLKQFEDNLSPGHIKLTGKIGANFKKWCLKEYSVIISPSADELEKMIDQNTYYTKQHEEMKKRIEQQNLSERRKEELKHLEDLDMSDFF